jgi:hypothetical protein
MRGPWRGPSTQSSLARESCALWRTCTACTRSHIYAVGRMRGFLRQLLLLCRPQRSAPRSRWRFEWESPHLTAHEQIACTRSRLSEIDRGFLPCPAGQERWGRLAWLCMRTLKVALLLRTRIAMRKACGVRKSRLRARRWLGRYTLPTSGTFLDIRIVRLRVGAVVPIRLILCVCLLAPLFNVC